MALTPEDVVKKSFASTHLRRGYDEQQVDDFLDEVVAELRRLTTENEELRTKLDECRKGQGLPPVASTTDAATAVPAALADTVVTDPESETVNGVAVADEQPADQSPSPVAEGASDEQDAAGQQDGQDARTPEGTDVPAAGGATEAGSDADQLADAGAVGGAAGVIALAQKLHDEHVLEGRNTRERLISEGEAHHERVVAEAEARHEELVTTAQSRHDELVSTGQARHDELVATGQAKHDELVSEAEQRKADILTELTNQRESLTGRIEQLKSFERDYRARLKAFITEQLTTLEHTGVEDTRPPASPDTSDGQPTGEPDGQPSESQDKHDRPGG